MKSYFIAIAVMCSLILLFIALLIIQSHKTQERIVIITSNEIENIEEKEEQDNFERDTSTAISGKINLRGKNANK